jgi:hypothetical protein
VLLSNLHIKKSNLSIENKKMTSYLSLTIKYKDLSVLFLFFFLSCNISIQINDLHLDVENERIAPSYKESITYPNIGWWFSLDFNIPNSQ